VQHWNRLHSGGDALRPGREPWVRRHTSLAAQTPLNAQDLREGDDHWTLCNAPLTRKPSVKIAPFSSATFWPTVKFPVQVCFYPRCRKWISQLYYTFSQSTESVPEIVIPWPLILTHDLNRRTWPRWCKDDSACQISWNNWILTYFV